jgi:ketosteroid isomerase-like protein
MRRLLTLGIVLLFAACGWSQQPQQTRGTQAEEIPAAKVREDWKRHFNAKKADAVAALYAEDAVVVSEAGTLRGRSEIRQWVQASIDQGSVLEAISSTQEKTSGTLAYGTGRSRRLVGQEVHLGQYLIVLEKIGGEWKIVQHFSVNVRETQPKS